MNDKEREIYNSIINSWQRTGRIGHSRPYNLSEARRQAYAVACSLANRQPTPIKTQTLTTSRQPIQLKLAYA